MYFMLTSGLLEMVNEVHRILSNLLSITDTLLMEFKCLSLAKHPFTKSCHSHTL